jgi:nitrogen fixation NifU-like protein
VKGKSIEEAVTVTNNVVADALGGLPAVKMHCSVLAEEALEEALKDYFKKQGEPEDQVIQLKKKAGIKIKEHHHDHDHDHDHE